MKLFQQSLRVVTGLNCSCNRCVQLQEETVPAVAACSYRTELFLQSLRAVTGGNCSCSRCVQLQEETVPAVAACSYSRKLFLQWLRVVTGLNFTLVKPNYNEFHPDTHIVSLHF